MIGRRASYLLNGLCGQRHPAVRLANLRLEKIVKIKIINLIKEEFKWIDAQRLAS